MAKQDLIKQAAIALKCELPSSENWRLGYDIKDGNVYKITDECSAKAICTLDEYRQFVRELWEGAPEGATHFRPNALAKWYKFSESGDCVSVSFFRGFRGGGMGWGRSMSYKRGLVSTSNLIPRPSWLLEEQKTSHVKITGLPNIGEFVEIDDDGSLMYGAGESGEVIAHVENTAVVRMSYSLGCFEARFLRPLRTEQEKEREKIIEMIVDDVKDSINGFDRLRFESIIRAILMRWSD